MPRLNVKNSFLKVMKAMGFSLGMPITGILKYKPKKEPKEERGHNGKKKKGKGSDNEQERGTENEGERKRQRECKPKQPRVTK